MEGADFHRNDARAGDTVTEVGQRTIDLSTMRDDAADSFGRGMVTVFGRQLISTLAFTILGLLLFALAFWIIGKISPFSIRKELEEDQNTALAIVIASIIIGIALIVSAAVHG